MSFSIGPYIGKRDAVIKAVKAVVVESTKSYPNQQLDEVAAFIVSELEKTPESKTCIAHAWGHSDSTGRWATIGVNQLVAPAVMAPMLVE